MDDFVGGRYAIVSGLYGVLSVVLFVFYGIDKAAARRGMRRIPERWLHMLAVLGGWPGALAGQLVFRHKTRKQPFRTIFWLTVVLNCLALAAFVQLGAVLA
ncbi:MAG: DUF1294 domain-containing protein [Coriobacteriia bacterium]